VPRISLSIRLGPMVRFDVQGDNCTEVAEALKNFEQLNQIVEHMFSDLAARVYPDGEIPAAELEGAP
jgi:N-acetylglutamate synthase/N-acetylornithine aminotransferase